MVGRSESPAGGEGGRLVIRQLVGVYPHHQPMLLGCFCETSRVFERERDRFNVDIDGAAETFRRRDGQKVVRRFPDPLTLILPLWYRVCRQAGGYDALRNLRRELSGQPQLP